MRNVGMFLLGRKKGGEETTGAKNADFRGECQLEVK